MYFNFKSYGEINYLIFQCLRFNLLFNVIYYFIFQCIPSAARTRGLGARAAPRQPDGARSWGAAAGGYRAGTAFSRERIPSRVEPDESRGLLSICTYLPRQIPKVFQ